MPLDVVETLCELVSIPSVNPMGREVAGAEFCEQALTDHLEAVFRQRGLAVERQEVSPRRSNILARLEGNRLAGEREQLIVWEAHQDTVPVDGMTIPPWTPEVRGGRVYGRGACDVKGGMAAMLAALSRLAEESPPGMPTLVLACSVNEEHGFTGAREMARSWACGESPLVPRIPDAVIVAEPTQLDVVVAHKGVVRWRCHARGRAAHSATPNLGSNAIYAMGHVLGALEDYAQRVVPQLGQHPRVGSPTLSVGLITGGISVNTVPDDCAIEIDRRLCPGEDGTAARQAVMDFLRDRCPGADIWHEEPFLATDPLADERNEDLGRHLSLAARAAGERGELAGVPYGTDAPAFDRLGVPTVVFGPGSIEQAHTSDEWIAVDQLRAASEILYRFGRRGLRGAD